MKKLLGGIVLSISMLAGSAQAANVAKMYFGAGVADGSVDASQSGTGDDMSLGSVSATLGFQLMDFVGVELQVGSASDQTSSVLSDPLFTYQAAMLRLGFRRDRAGVYLLGGQSRLELGSSIGSGSSDSENVFGFGINLFGNETTSLNFHVLRFGEDGELRTTTIGFQHYFGGFR